MHIEFPEAGGVLIVGDEEELRGLADTLIEAIHEGDAIGQLLTNESVEQVTARCLNSEAGWSSVS
jgi:hypothetical protein